MGTYGVGYMLITALVWKMTSQFPTPGARVVAFLLIEGLVMLLFGGILILSIIGSMISRRNKTLLTEHTLRLAEDQFYHETPFAKTELKWSILQKLHRTRQYIFLYVAQHSAHVIPRRAFSSDEEWDAFYEFCRRKAG